MDDPMPIRPSFPIRSLRGGEVPSRRRTFRIDGRIDGDGLVCLGQPVAAPPIPGVLEAMRPDVRLPEWMRSRRERVFELLHRHGALLFRGFPLRHPSALERVMRSLRDAEPVTYEYRSTPRTRVEGRVYTSTEYPADRVIPQHSEQAYSRSFPRELGFLCLTPPHAGGATPVADNRLVLSRIPKDVRRRFERHGVLYVRNYGGPLDLGWREVFQTEDRDEVERYGAGQGIELEWMPEGRLRTRQVCPAVLEHPETGEGVWFNQAHLFHVSALGTEDRAALLALCGGEDGLPRHACFGNGAPIPAADLDAVRAAIAAETVRFDWWARDLLLVDNLLTSHGREAFEGERRVVVCMAGSVSSPAPQGEGRP